MLENPKILREIVDLTGAKSTDMLSLESVDHLCSKCDVYAENWQPYAEKLWSATQVEKENAKKTEPLKQVYVRKIDIKKASVKQ